MTKTETLSQPATLGQESMKRITKVQNMVFVVTDKEQLCMSMDVYMKIMNTKSFDHRACMVDEVPEKARVVNRVEDLWK